MQLPDGKGMIDLGPGALSLTGMMADPATDSWKRMLFLKQLERFVVPAIIY